MPRKTVFPPERQAFGEETTCTLVNRPNFRISSSNRAKAPAAHTASYAPEDDFTFIRRALIWVLSTLAYRPSLRISCASPQLRNIQFLRDTISRSDSAR